MHYEVYKLDDNNIANLNYDGFTKSKDTNKIVTIADIKFADSQP
jgi:hypothetical protein